VFRSVYAIAHTIIEVLGYVQIYYSTLTIARRKSTAYVRGRY